VLTQLGRLALADGDVNAARDRFRSALGVDPSYVDAMILIAYLDLKAGREDEARRWYDHAIEADPADPNPYLQYGDLYFRKADFAEAKRWYEKALQVDPDNFVGALQAGTSALRLADLETAARYLQRASEIDPGSWKPLYNVACVQIHRGQTAAALGSLHKAMQAGLADRALLERDPCFAALRSDPRFQRLAQ
jgi:Tfp pilus assembly protein PilF